MKNDRMKIDLMKFDPTKTNHVKIIRIHKKLITISKHIIFSYSSILVADVPQLHDGVLHLEEPVHHLEGANPPNKINVDFIKQYCRRFGI
jgi:hypothetical protein